jgi:L-aspartate oxidase
LQPGGVGQIYQNTTNPIIATGDGIAMAYRVKALIENMEFIQFHPTALYHPHTSSSFLISEAVRGFGGLLRNKSGVLFMHLYDQRKELASRDIVSRAIDSELKKSGDECVFLDCRHLNMEDFKKHFPNILQKVNEIGIDLKQDMIPVVPAAHYLCGGIVVDESGQTSVENLYACGECACTGLHGANRLASNSLLEALVFAHRSYLKSVDLVEKSILPSIIPNWDEEGTVQPKELILITHNLRELQALMSDYVGIIRSKERLTRAANRLKVLYEETEVLYKMTKISPQLIELRNMITVAYLVVQQSRARRENRGVFFQTDN